jgi:hypothetical protein
MFVSLVGLLAVPALADTTLRKVDHVGRIVYDMATGQISKDDGTALRGSVSCWDSTCTTGYFSGQTQTDVWLDWGDLPVGCEVIDCFQIGYATNVPLPHTIDIIFSESDNGFCDAGRVPNVAFRITGLPGQGAFLYTGWLVTLIPVSPIDLSAAVDLDADGAKDFSYTYQFRTPHDGVTTLCGPLLAGDPNCGAVGAENAFDIYDVDPNNPVGPNDLLIPDVNTLCVGTFWFGGVPYAQLYMDLLQGDANTPVEDCSCGDIEPSGGDGDVDLTDLAVLLANFGGSGLGCDQGDVEPAPGGVDGDVDLTDLAVMLANFGGTCP